MKKNANSCIGKVFEDRGDRVAPDRWHLSLLSARSSFQSDLFVIEVVDDYGFPLLGASVG